MRWPWSAERDSPQPHKTDDLIRKSEGLRLELLATTGKLSEYTKALQSEITRLKSLAERVNDDG